MSGASHDSATGGEPAVDALIARAAAADACAPRRAGAIAADLATPDAWRLDDETRALIAADLERLTAAIVADLRRAGDRKGADAPGAADTGTPIVTRLIAAGLLDDHRFVEELAARAWTAVIAARLPAGDTDSDQPSLLPRLANAPDRLIAGAASAMMAAQGRRRTGGLDSGRDDLPAELQHHLVWWVAAALDTNGSPDAGLIEGARRVLAAHDEGARLEAVAERLAGALDSREEALAGLISEALDDRNLVLIAALLARGLAIDVAAARAILIDPAGDRLWLALRALDLPRDLVARLGMALAAADRRRDEQGFVDLLDSVMAMAPGDAAAALAAIRLPRAWREARAALARR
jgi:hypothetical protein